jgi:hypothetical protein
MIYPGEGKKGQPKAGDYVLAAEQTRAEAAASPHRSTAFDLARADKWEGRAYSASTVQNIKGTLNICLIGRPTWSHHTNTGGPHP